MGAKVLVEFTTAAPGSNRDQLYRTKTKLRGSGLYIAESLTQRRQELFQKLLRLKRDATIFTAFTQSGDLFARKTRSSPPVRVRDHAALERLSGPGQSRGRAQAQGLGSSPRPPLTAGLVSAVSSGGGSGPVADPSPPGPGLAWSGPSATPVFVLPPTRPSPAAPSNEQRGAVVVTAHPSASGGLDAPVRPVEADRQPPPPASPAGGAPPGGRRDAGVQATASTPPSDTRDTEKDGRSATTRRRAATTPSTVRVSVRGRSRVINVTNAGDVMETLRDLVNAAKRESGHAKHVDRFVCDFDQRVSELSKGADEGHVNRGTASSARRVRKMADQWLRASWPGRESGLRLTPDSSSSRVSGYYSE